MKRKGIITVSPFLLCSLAGISGTAYSCDYCGQPYFYTVPSFADSSDKAPDSIKELEFQAFREMYGKNKAAGQHLENLELICKNLPHFCGTEYEVSLYEARTESVYLSRQQKKAPLALYDYFFDVRENAGYVIADITNTDFKNIVSLKVEFDVLDIYGKSTGDRRDFYYAVGADIAPGESGRFIWQVNNMSGPTSVGTFRVLEIVFDDASKWYHHYEN